MIPPSLKHFAEPYAAQGNIDARAASRAIGKPQLDPWDVFLRETLQNSWDARLGEGGVTYSVDAFWPSHHQVGLLKDVVFRDRIGGSPLDDFLRASLDVQPVLVVTDRGTKGLGGGTRADRVGGEGEPTDFVDFVRNVGRAADKALGGGTYGFGKGILWQVSNCSTVIVYSRSTHGGAPVSRLIAIGHTDSYAVNGQRFTGRHWWGESHPETKIEPIEGAAADQLARALGMDRLDPGESGTSIMVLEPMASEAAETLDDIVGRVADAALWWAWPHMVDKTVEFEFTYEGQPVEHTRPESHEVLRHFADAYQLAAGADSDQPAWPWNREVVMMRRPEMRLGALVWRNVSTDELPTSDTDRVEIKSHVALMRRPRFIVKYMPVRASAQGLGTVGVFVADGSLNDDFAKAEPVAHDDWQPTLMGLEKGARNPVRRALENIKDIFQRVAVVVPPEDEGARRRKGLVHLATGLGDLVSTVGEDARIAPGKRSASGGTSAPRKAAAKVVGRPTLLKVDGRTCASFIVEVSIPRGEESVLVHGRPAILSEGSSEGGSVSGARAQDVAAAEEPELLYWRFGGGAREGSSGLTVSGAGKHEVEAVVSIPRDSAVALTLRVDEVSA